jgi:hypothetical protein
MSTRGIQSSVHTFFGKSMVKVIFSVIITAIVSLYVMTTYTSGPLDGTFNKYLMQAERWGIPDELKNRGVESLYRDDWNAGWDGQFYYYIANDLLAQKDTIQHLDADAYRYQRVGIPLLSYVMSLITFQDWVSPALFYFTHLMLILLGTAIGAYFFNKRGVSPYWIIPWSVGLGTQITLLNGLPDGAADALLILALFACFKKKYYIYSFAVTFACLAREAYILFPLIYFAGHIYHSFTSDNKKIYQPYYFLLTFPIVVFTAWHIFVRTYFIQTPGEQAHGILSLPFVSIYRHLFAGFSGSYPNIPDGFHSYIAGVGIFLFVCLMLYVFYLSFKINPLSSLQKGNVFLFAISVFSMLLASLYVSFGDSVIWNFTGYMKAASLFVFIVPLLLTLRNKKPGKRVLIFLISLTVFFGIQGWQLRVNQPAIKYKVDVECQHIKFKGNKCLEKFIWNGDELPGTTGKIFNGRRVAYEGMDKAGFLTYGPYIDLPKGIYKIELKFSADAQYSGYVNSIGISSVNGTVVYIKDLPLDGVGSHFSRIISISDEMVRNFEVRMWYGKGDLSLKTLSVERLNDEKMISIQPNQ